MWRSGELVTLRFRSIDGRFYSGRPLRVIEHTPELLVTYMPEGTVVSMPMLADGRGLRDVPLDERWSHPRTSLLRPWNGTELIQLFPRGRAHSLWVVRDAAHAMVGWYVNPRRDRRGAMEGRGRAGSRDTRRPRHAGAGDGDPRRGRAGVERTPVAHRLGGLARTGGVDDARAARGLECLGAPHLTRSV